MVDTASDQVFRGYEGSSSIIQAVDETRSMALYAGSAIASCYYSASNGGQTEATRNVWGGNLSYSTVKDDPYDLANPSATVKTAAIRRDATGLDERLMQALRQGAGGAEIAAILDIEPHSPKYARPQPPVYQVALHRGDGGRPAVQRGRGHLRRAGGVVRPEHQFLQQRDGLRRRKRGRLHHRLPPLGPTAWA